MAFSEWVVPAGNCLLWVQGVMQSRRQEKKPAPPALGVFAAMSALTVLVCNFWLVSAWPYLLQLLKAWTMYLVIYLGFIQNALDQKVEDVRGTRYES